MSAASHHARSRGAVAAAFFWQGLVFIHLTTRLPELTDRWHLSETRLSLLLLMMVLLAGAGSALAERRAGRRGSAEALVAGLVVVGAGARRSRRQPRAVALRARPSRRTAWPWAPSTPSSNMQAVALEHHYGRTILPSFHGAWTLGGMAGAALTLATAGHPRATLAGALVLAAASLLFLAAAVPAGGGGPARHRRRRVAVPWRPLLLVGLGLVVFYMVDTAATTWGPTYLDRTFDTPAGLVALATFPYLLASGLLRIARRPPRHGVRRGRGAAGRRACSPPRPWPSSCSPRPGRWRCSASPCSAPASR